MGRRTISMTELDGFQLDDSGQLFWRDQAVILERRIGLEGPTFWVALIATLATVISAVWPIVDHFWL